MREAPYPYQQLPTKGSHDQADCLKEARDPLADERYSIAPRDALEGSSRTPPSWRWTSLLLAVTGAAALGFLCGTHYQSLSSTSAGIALPHDSSSPKKCPSPLPLLASPPASTNPWAPLSPSEIRDIKAWLFHPSQNLNLTDALVAKDSDNIVFGIEAYPPAKDDVLSFLDSPPSSPLNTDENQESKRKKTPPILKRFARVTIDHGGLPAPLTRDYLLGPLPISGKTKMRQLTEIYHRPDVPFNARGLPDVTRIFEAVGRAVGPMADAIQDLFGGTITGNTLTDTFVGNFGGGWSFNGSSRRLWISWKVNAPGIWLLPINFYNYVDLSGSDPSLWRVLKVVYHNQTFSSMESFVRAWKDGTLVRFPRPELPTRGNATETPWASRKRTGTPRDLEHLPGPRSVSFAGPRFRVHKEQNYITWLGWAMYLSFDRDMGLSLHDIRFKNSRIIYELAPQDCLVQYSGFDPVQSATSWLDRYFGMGALTRDLMMNYDCPQDAVYLGATTYDAVLGVVRRERAVCVFEMDTGRPVTRHFGEWAGETGVVKGYVLTVRSVASLGNYDYYGTIEVKLSASGYLQGGYWNPAQEGYGSRIHQHSMGNVHDHVINFKVDLDIAGRNNTLRKASAQTERVHMPWLDAQDDWIADFPETRETLQQKIEYAYITNEDDARVRYSLNQREGYAIVNKDEKNRWGSEKGYAVHPGLSPVHNNIEKSRRLLNNANWASHHFSVSLRKETEPSSSSMWNLNLPGAPPVDFDRFFDGEDIEQKDLVLWINVGTHHQPVAEDSPNTKTNIASSSFFLTPVNYFDSDPSMELLNGIVLDPLTNHPRSGSLPGQPSTHPHAKHDDSLANDRENKKVPGHLPAYTYDDNGVQQHFHCIPDAPQPFWYDAQVGVVSDEMAAGMDEEGRERWRKRVQGIMNPFVLRFGA